MREREPGQERDALPTTLFLLRGYGRGEAGAFTQLYERHAPAIARSVAARMGVKLRGIAELDDVLQETFLAAWQHLEHGALEHVRTIGGFRHLLAKIALQKAIDALRGATRGKRDRRRVDALDPGALAREADRPSRLAIAHELADEAEDALLALDEADRWILDCRDNLGASYEEIAEELGTRPANAKLRCHRARERWKSEMKKRLG